MSRAPPLLCLTFAALAACSGEPARSDAPVEAQQGGGGGRPGEDASAAPSLPEDPESFRIQLSGTACFGSCPTYSVSIDQTGQVEFEGVACVARPGKYYRQIDPVAARSLYDALSATEYGRLQDRYVSREDGCALATDAPTSLWNVRADGFEKSLERYHGCYASIGPAPDFALRRPNDLEAIDALEPLVHERADVLRYLEPNPPSCVLGSGPLPLTSLRLSKDGVPLAIIELKERFVSSLKSPDRFELRDCAGAPIASGFLRSEREHLVLLQDDLAPIAFPSIGSAASLIVELSGDWRAPPAAIVSKAQALREQPELDLELDVTVADSCD